MRQAAPRAAFWPSSTRVASPEVMKAVQASRGTFSASSWATTSLAGRGELEIRTTGPFSARNRARAAQASGKLSRPLWMTPQTSLSSTS